MASDGSKQARKAGGRKRQALLRASIEEGPNYLLAPQLLKGLPTLSLARRFLGREPSVLRPAVDAFGWIRALADEIITHGGPRRAAGRLQELLERQPIQARQILRKLLVGRLSFEPFEDAGSRGYHIRGQATYGRLLSGVVSVVPPGRSDARYSRQIGGIIRAA